MPKKGNTKSNPSSNSGTNYGGGFGKVHIVHDTPPAQNSIPTTNKTPPPPKSKISGK